MTRYDDALLNLSNPLRLRSQFYGAPPSSGAQQFLYRHLDENFLAVVRDAGAYDPSRRYLINESVWLEGIQYRAIQDLAPGVDPWLDDGSNWSVFAPRTGYGDMDMEALATPGSDITATFQALNVFDTIPITPLGVSFDLPNSTFAFEYKGLWDLTLNVFMQFDDSNQGRTMQFRLFNVTDNAPTPGVTVAIGRNAAGFNLSIPFTQRVLVGDKGDVFRIEIGGASSTVSGVVYDFVSFGARQTAAIRPNIGAGE